MVERFHRSLKSDLKVQLDCVPFPLILFRLRSAPQDFHCLSPGLVYDATLRLPGQMTVNKLVFSWQVEYKNFNVSHITTKKANKPTHLLYSLRNCAHVFMKGVATSHPRQLVYKNSFRVLCIHDKYITMDIDKWEQSIALDRIKPAF